MLSLGQGIAKAAKLPLQFIKDNLKLYLDFKSSKSDTLKFPSEGSTYFSGSNQYIEITDNSDLDIAQGESLTFACWLNAQDTGTNEVIFAKRHSNIGYSILWHSSEKPQFSIQDSAGNNYYSYTSNALSYNTWYHYAVVWNSSTMKATHYVNGIDAGVSFENDATLVDASNSGVARIGILADSTSYDFKGYLANMGIWKRVLSQEEIQSIMNKSYSQLKGVEKTSLVSWWALDQNELTALNFDSTGDRAENTSFTTHQSDTGTLSGWFKFDDVSTQQRFFGVGGTTTAGATRSIEVDGGNVFFIGYAVDWDSGADIVANNWYHLALTWNGTSVVIYVNGTAYSQTLSQLVTPTGTKIQVGGAVWNGQFELNGQVKSASFYTSTLSQSEIQSIYNNGINYSEIGNTNLAHYWVMDNETTVKDLVGSNDLTVTGATLVTNARQSDSKSTNHGATIGATTTTSVYGGNAPILPRAVDVAKEGQADAIGNGSLTTSSGGYADLGNDSLIQFWW